MNEYEVAERAAELLRRCGINAAAQDTGGGMVCIVIASDGATLDEPALTFGTAGQTWAAQLADGDPGCQEIRS